MFNSIKLHSRTKNEKGVTLVELLAVIVISSLVIATVTYVIQYTMNNYRATADRQKAQADATFVTEMIIKSVRERSNQDFVLNDPTSDCVLKLEISQSTDHTCYSFDPDEGTLRLIKTENDSTTLNQVISSQLSHINIDIIGDKLELSLYYTIMNHSDFQYETTVYIPKL